MIRGVPAGDEAAWPPQEGGRPMKWAEVDADALRANIAALVGHVGPRVDVIAMVKANGYGHGAVLVSRCALEAGARRLGVSSPEEALQLRAAGIAAPVLTVGWTRPDRQEALVRAGVEMTVFDEAAVAGAAAAARRSGRRAHVHIKVDTGMGRLGVRPESLEAVLDACRHAATDVRVAGVLTHFADADGVDGAFTEVQHERFLDAVARVRDLAPDALVHCANSAATLRFPEMHHDAVRPGIALYGYPPCGATGVVALQPAMTVLACVTQVKTVRAGDTVGYGRTWTAERDTRIATLASGYADGVHRAQSNRGAVLVGGVRCPVVGRVSMDQVGVDVSAVDGVGPGDEAVLVGGRHGAFLGADEVAEAGGTISYEVLCAVSARVPRYVVGAPPG